ncbi:hypothetical protein CHELA20_52982 [Hyphomicrobiales bacterium]|nr:hypothetical protein CHELA41_21942 [Hyphomicrobiales bacterium]CAH1683336.1 hypothetical protein CHELA20_52982 [Hyphomicrobiales bacterium]
MRGREPCSWLHHCGDPHPLVDQLERLPSGEALQRERLMSLYTGVRTLIQRGDKQERARLPVRRGALAQSFRSGRDASPIKRWRISLRPAHL